MKNIKNIHQFPVKQQITSQSKIIIKNNEISHDKKIHE
jgi:hypothetical protein